jgi:hypothetical protein
MRHPDFSLIPLPPTTLQPIFGAYLKDVFASRDKREEVRGKGTAPSQARHVDGRAFGPKSSVWSQF